MFAAASQNDRKPARLQSIDTMQLDLWSPPTTYFSIESNARSVMDRPAIERILSHAPIEWLMEDSNPSIRFLTLRDVLCVREGDPRLRLARDAIRSSSVVSRILSKQAGDGHWGNLNSPYSPKYKASYWQMIVLGLLHADGSDERIKRGIEHIFRFQQRSGAFSAETMEQHRARYESHLRKGKIMPPFEEWSAGLVREQEISCLTGNMISALARLSYGDDSRVKRAVRWLVEVQNEDGGWKCPYWRAHFRDKHACFHGTICVLEGFSELKPEAITRSVENAIDRGVEFMLMHRLFKADHHGYAVINEDWKTLRFPWFAGHNILRGLDVVTKLGFTEDERLTDALDVLLGKMRPDFRWVLERGNTGRMLANLEKEGGPSKWITLTALRVLRRISRQWEC